MVQSIVTTVTNRIREHGRGWVFTPHHFADLSSDTGVRSALSRLQKAGVIRRVTQGIYDYPRVHKILGTLSPPVDAIAKAFAEKNGAQIQASGAYAANVIGFSEQVPGQIIFLTDGPSGRLKIGKLVILFKKTTVKNMFGAGSQEALVIQALKFMKEKNINQTMLETTKKFLKSTTKRKFQRNLKFAPHWIRAILLNLMENEL